MTEILLPSNDDGTVVCENGMESNNNDFALHLKPVFDACDWGGDGFVLVQDLIDLGKQYSIGNSGEELELILRKLDDGGNGRISFEEFCFKVQQIFQQEDDVQPSPRDRVNSLEVKLPVHQRRMDNSVDTNHNQPLIDLSEISEENRARSHTDSEGFFEEIDTLSHSTTSTNELEDPKISSPLKNGKYVAPPSSYFAQMKQNTNIYSTYPPDGRLPKKKRKNILNLQYRQLSKTSEYQSQELGFEAFGEGEGEDWDESIASEPQPDLLSPDVQLNGNRLPRRISGNHIASRLVQSAKTSLNGSAEEMRAGSFHRGSFSESDGDFSFLSDEIKKLSSQLTILKLDQDDHEDKQRRLREENKMFMNKINALEEQLQDQRSKAEKTVQEESQKYRRELQKVQRDHAENIDRLQIKLQEAEGEIQNLKTVEPMLRKEIEQSLEERRQAQQKIEDLHSELIDKEKEIEQLKYKLKFKTDELEREKHERAEEVMILTHEIENLKYMKNAAINQFDEHTDLLKQIEIMKKENNNLKSAQDDLRNQMLQQNTLIELEKEHNLADELQTADKGHVLDALRAEENENHRLRQYIDQLLILIIQSDPMLLEK